MNLSTTSDELLPKFYRNYSSQIWTAIITAAIVFGIWGAVETWQHRTNSTNVFEHIVKWLAGAVFGAWMFGAGSILTAIGLGMLVEAGYDIWRRLRSYDILPIGHERAPRIQQGSGLKGWGVLGVCIVIAVGIYACATRYTYYPSTRTRIDHWTGHVSKTP